MCNTRKVFSDINLFLPDTDLSPNNDEKQMTRKRIHRENVYIASYPENIQPNFAVAICSCFLFHLVS